MIATTPAPINVKNSAPTHGGERLGFGLGGGCRLCRLERLLGMRQDDIRSPGPLWGGAGPILDR